MTPDDPCDDTHQQAMLVEAMLVRKQNTAEISQNLYDNIWVKMLFRIDLCISII